jgi:sulfur-oxidizing protein SoxA
MKLAHGFVVAGLALASPAATVGEIPLGERHSGYELMTPELRAMQDDDAANPGMLSVLDGEALWNRADGASGKSCARCHGDATSSMRGVATRYPAVDAVHRRPIDLEQRVNVCRVEYQQAPPLAFESKELLALAAYLGHLSKGLPITIADGDETRPFIAAGREIFELRQGQLNLSCAQCHDDNWGQHLAGASIPQAHPTGYPLYRLEWQSLGSLRRRLRACMIGMRAEPYADVAPEIVDLELYLAWRARGLNLETPAVRP